MSTVPSKRKAPTDNDQVQSEAKRRADEIAKRIRASMGGKATNGATPPAARTPASASPAPTGGNDDVAKRLAAAKARLEARRAAETVPTIHKSIEEPPSRGSAPVQELRSSEDVRSSIDDMKARFAASRAQRRPDGVLPPQQNRDRSVSTPHDRQTPAREITPAKSTDGRDVITPYAEGAESREATPAEAKYNPYLGHVRGVQPARKLREFTLQRVGAPSIQQAAKVRQRDAIDDIRSRIETTTQKTVAELSVFTEPEPPELEWWDVGLINQMDGEIDDGIVTDAILHPVIMEPVQNMLYSLPAAKTYLTKREIKKKRRVARFYVNQEKQSKIRLGLVPPPEPKIRQANAMKVYPEMAVSNPSLLQKKWQTQVAERAAQHEATNKERQLTKEQREQRNKENAEKNASMGLFQSIYRVYLNKDEIHNKHKFLINTNLGYWHDATGIVMIAPSATLMIVEAGEKATKELQKLFCRRIKWQAIRLGNGDLEVGNELVRRDLQKADDQRTLQPEVWDPIEKRDATCRLVWQGEVRNRRFKKWGGLRPFETDADAKALLGAVKLHDVWGALGVKGNAKETTANPAFVGSAPQPPSKKLAPDARPAVAGEEQPKPEFDLVKGAHDRAIDDWMKGTGKKMKYKLKLDHGFDLDEEGLEEGQPTAESI